MKAYNYFFKSILSILICILWLNCSAQMDMAAMHGTTKPQRPLSAPSNEATKKQLKFARAEGDSVDRCIEWIRAHARISGQLRAGEYLITYAVTPPEGWYNYSNRQLTWEEPDGADAHLWLFVQDGADHRIVPPLEIKAVLNNPAGHFLVSKTIRYAWTPLINGYGENFKLTGNGLYTLHLQIEPPRYYRHDPYNGDRFYKLTLAEIPLWINKNDLSGGRLSDLMEKQQRLSAGAGHAFANTLKVMYKQANDGKDTVKGDYKIACAVEYAEGYWNYEKDQFRYKIENDMSGITNAHVEVAVLDRQTGRFMHNLNVYATVYKKNQKIGEKPEMFMWHPWLYHYGENWRVPSASKDYRVHVHFDPPLYRRYGQLAGKQFAHGEDVDFEPIHIKTGQK